MSGKAPANARLAAVAALIPLIYEPHGGADEPSASGSLSSRDEAFSQHLVYGVLRWYGALDWIVNRLLNQPLKIKDRDVHLLICLGIFQLWKDATPAHAAVHATAECARALNKPWAVGLINALLRRFQREHKSLIERLHGTPRQYAHPAWLLTQIKRDWPDQWQDIVAANNQHAPLWLRINRNRADHDQVTAQLQARGFTTTLNPAAPDAVAIEPAVSVGEIPGFAEGRVSVQDPAAQMALQMIRPAHGERVLDACCAPGGKTCHLLEHVPGLQLVALDRDASRLGLVTENLQRLGLNCTLQQADAGDPSAWWDTIPFDKILLDAPCSTTGVIRRHPDIKHLRSPSQVGHAVAEQRRLLEALWPLLKAGGILVYATCSVLKCENHQQIHEFLSRHPNAGLVDREGNQIDTANTGLQILPGQQGMDGFFYAIIHKSA